MTMKLIDKYNDAGINKHTVWIFEQNGKRAGIDHNHDVYGASHYLFSIDGERHISHGEGCSTVWYPSLNAAKAMLQKYLNGEIRTLPDGSDAKACDSCKGSFACEDFKKQFEKVSA